MNATVTGCRTGSEGGGGYSGTLGAKVGGKVGRLRRAGLTGWGVGAGSAARAEGTDADHVAVTLKVTEGIYFRVSYAD